MMAIAQTQQAAQWTREPVYIIAGCVLACVLVLMTWKLARRRYRKRLFKLSVKYPLKGHRWLSTEFLQHPTYCNSCMQLCVCGSTCEACGLCLCTDTNCLRALSSKEACKPLSLAPGSSEKDKGKVPHFWVHGNLPISSMCLKCLNPCGNCPRLCDYKCVWCLKTAHEDCMDDVEENGTANCSLGPFHSLVIPPTCVSLSLEGWRGRRKPVLKTITPPIVDHWRPLVVLANPKSGGKDGEMLISSFRKLLNPVQVIDLSENPPESGLEICRLLPNQLCRVLVCGGDGTVGWVLGAIERSDLVRSPHVAILPLGTGNDLARVLGWGRGYEDEDVGSILRDVEHSQLSLLDRWEVKVERKRYLGLRKEAKVLTMNNYMGVGCDAGVALNFHRQRETMPDLFSSRIINKAWYVVFGARDIIEQSCKNLNKKIELYLDGKPKKLPQLEGIVLLNINSWSSGCAVWRDEADDSLAPSRMDDQLLEVVGLYSSLHVGKIQVSLSDAVRIGQAKEIKIIIHESVPVQVDGEPWQQGPSSITISHKGQAFMLKKVSHDN